MTTVARAFLAGSLTIAMAACVMAPGAPGANSRQEAPSIAAAPEVPGDDPGTQAPSVEPVAPVSPERPVDATLAAVSRSNPGAAASEVLDLCYVDAFGVDAIAGMAEVPRARDLPMYVNLVGVEPEIRTDAPAWVISFRGKVTLPRGLGWAIDPTCVVIDGERTLFLTGPHGRGDNQVDPLPVPNPPTLALPPLAP